MPEILTNDKLKEFLTTHGSNISHTRKNGIHHYIARIRGHELRLSCVNDNGQLYYQSSEESRKPLTKAVIDFLLRPGPRH